jgi:hypothetical protein
MRISTYIVMLFFCTNLLAQKSNLYQIFADDINQQIFIDKHVNHIDRKFYDYDTITKKLKPSGSVKIDYDPVKKLCTTYNSIYKITDYWKSDSNGVNNFSYDKQGKRVNLEEQDTSPPVFEKGRAKIIYNTLLFYNAQNKISKVMTDTLSENINPYHFMQCYYTYRHDSIVEEKTYSFRYIPKNTDFTDTLSKSILSRNAGGSQEIIYEKNNVIKILKYTKNNVDFEDTVVNGLLVSRAETYYGVAVAPKGK